MSLASDDINADAAAMAAPVDDPNINAIAAAADPDSASPARPPNPNVATEKCKTCN
eukprot:CAMPEP_0197174848 /NCGR_PEP_ID=MMETSP1423-20130617/1216_1 /TAXON_ID=476441 /ORGANISM="Pseudo-nitzschia heimii, Strain UNC1101" /LENGTH=55 /DNA_ID=CAMNT_0042623843 /DNA_START=395 /DNA_END=562 /DNA_ORIENTATION=+